MIRIVGRTWFVAGLLVVLESVASGQTPLTTAFTHQGQLKLGGAPLNDYADFRFSVWNTLSGGQQVGAEYQINGVTVANGLFTIRVDPGVNVFSGDARWLQIALRYPTSAGSFVTLAPRQWLTAATALRDAIVEFDPAVHEIERPGTPNVEGMPRALHENEADRSGDPRVVGSTAQIPGTSESRDGEIKELRARVETLEVMIARLSSAHKEGAR